MARWQGSWLVWTWLLLPGLAWGEEPLLIPRAADDAATDVPLRLSRPTSNASRPLSGSSKPSAVKSSTGWATATGSLLFVLAIIVVGGYVFSRQGIRLPGMLPPDVVQVLGKRYLDARSTIQLVRCGSKILVLANSTQQGLRTLSEITDPQEVEQITGQCLPTGMSGSSVAVNPPHVPIGLRHPVNAPGPGGSRG